MPASDELFRTLVASVRDYAIFALDPTGRIETWNQGAEQLKGYRADEAVGQHFSIFYPPEDVSAGKCEYELEVAAREGRFEDEGWRVRKDGSRFWANVVITAVRDKGVLVGFAKVTRDLTTRVAAESARLAAEERFRRLVESVTDYALITLDPEGRIATWNTGASLITGWSANEIIGKHFSVFYRPEDVRAGKCELELDVASREGRFEDENIRVRKDGSTFWANVVVTAVRDADGKLLGFSKVTRDLTERRRSEDERAARFAAERANRTKDEFLAILGHELRNPLAPIVAALDLIKLRGERTHDRELEIVERQVDHLLHLVDDLLDISRVTTGKIELKRRAIDLRDAAAKAAEIVAPTMSERRHQFDVELGSAPVTVNGDEPRLVQVITNLLVNAARYTPPGGRVLLEVRGGSDRARIVVRDNGTGIEPEQRDQIFDMFVQGRQSIERPMGGLGLGLSLVRSLTELHDGRVTVESDGIGRGSTFTVELPLLQDRSVPAEANAPEAPAVHQRRRVLLVDDNVDASVLLGEVLELKGYEVLTATNGEEALTHLATFTPDVAILDLGLPGMDGFELARELRARVATPLRLFALTGYGTGSDLERTRAAGFEVHLVKPVDLALLLRSLAS